MARLGLSIELPPIDWRAGDINASMAAHDGALDALQDASDALAGTRVIVGRLIKFQVADGYAIYRVESAKPLTLAHVRWGDCYSVSDATIRGLNVTDVRKQLEAHDRLRSIFSKGVS